jgi:signal transduction histidine kinase
MAEPGRTRHRRRQTPETPESGGAADAETASTLSGHIAASCAIAALGLNTVAVLGWALGWDFVTNIEEGNYPIAPSAAVFGLVASSAIAIHAFGRRIPDGDFIATVVAVACIGMLAWIAVESFADTGLDLESMLAPQDVSTGATELIYMSPLALYPYIGICAIILVFSIERLRAKQGIITTASWGATGIMLIGVVSVVGYAYGSPMLYGGEIRPIALLASASLVFLGLTILTTDGLNLSPTAAFVGDGERAKLLRVFVPMTAGMVLVNGWVLTAGTDGGLNPATVVSISAIASALFAGAITLLFSQSFSEKIRLATEMREKAYSALEQTNKKLGLLSSITRHDTINQLSVMLGWMQLADETNTDQVVGEYLKNALAAAQPMRSKLEFTSAYEQVGVRSPRWISVPVEVSDTLSSVSMPEVDINTMVDGLDVYADPMFGKVLGNLLSNSIMHGKKVHKIGLSAHESGPSLVLVYSDDGVGIPDEDKGRLFTKGFGKHTGYGLYLSREILAITGITIEETGREGEGARFEMTIPPGKFRFHARAPRQSTGGGG